jgi:ABC-type sulfate transport system substrate-binding protein
MRACITMSEHGLADIDWPSAVRTFLLIIVDDPKTAGRPRWAWLRESDSEQTVSREHRKQDLIGASVSGLIALRPASRGS